MDNVVKLTDESGCEVFFEFLDLISWKGDEFVILLPVGSEDGEVTILRLENDNGETESYISDEDTLMTVFSLFKDRWKSEFDFADE